MAIAQESIISHIRTIRLTERDFEILKLIAKHRFVRSDHVRALVDGSNQQLTRRLQYLFYDGYLERVPIRQSTKRNGGSEPLVYGLNFKGADILKEVSPLSFERLNFLYRQHAKNESIEHALMITDFVTKLELEAREHSDIDFIDQDLIRDEIFTKARQFVWAVKLTHNNLPARITTFPDQVFAIHHRNKPSGKNINFYFFEADRGRMSITRRGLEQSSIFRKMLAYNETRKQLLHTKYFNFPHFKVIILTSSPERVKNMIEANKALNHGQGSGLFLFCDRNSFEKNPLLTLPLPSGRDDFTTRLIDG